MSNLQPYVDQLLEDIKQASRQPVQQKTPIDEKEELEDHRKALEAYLDQSSWIPLEKTSGLDPSTFPSVELLSTEQQLQLINAIHEMLGTWNIMAAIPKKVPMPMAYNLLIGILKEGFPRLEHGQFVYDFCTGNTDGCELGEYCPCIELEKRCQEEEGTKLMIEEEIKDFQKKYGDDWMKHYGDYLRAEMEMRKNEKRK